MLEGGATMLVSPTPPQSAVERTTPSGTGYYVVSPSSTHYNNNQHMPMAMMEDYCCGSGNANENGSSSNNILPSRYSSSSQGSNNNDHPSCGYGGPIRIMFVRDVLVAEDEEENDDDADNDDEGAYQLRPGGGHPIIRGLTRSSRREGGGCCGKYLSITTTTDSSSSWGPSCCWTGLQIGWRAVLSLAAALLVFYICTKPPPPKFHIQMAGIQEFGLNEGVDATGIPTKILTCNCSINLQIDNKSNIFGLHVHLPIMELSFGLIPFAMSRGTKLLAETYGSTSFKLYVGTKNKPMYGAGRSMQDMLVSPRGLPLTLGVSLTSNFRVVGDLIKPKFHHHVRCSFFLRRIHIGNEHRPIYNSTCIITA